MNKINEILNKYNGNESKVKETAKPWKGFKDLVLVDKVKECEDIISFYFRAVDNSKLVKHVAGQFLPFKIKTENPKYKEVIRTYSLSMKPNEDIYRISVKRIEGGLISSYLHDNMQIGDKIEAMVPAGIFTLEKDDKSPIVLMAGGIGITPLLSMLYEKYESKNELYFIQAAQNSEMHAFKNDIKSIANMTDLKSYVFYDRPLETDELGKDYNNKGFITKEWIQETLPLNAQFYFCGPPPFMKGINKSLLALGVSKDKIHYEFFGEAQSLE